MFKVHQLVFDGRVPPLNLECIESWRALPEDRYTVQRWNNEQLRKCLVQCPPVVRKCLERAKNFGEASDILRIAVLDQQGGIYMDWDILLADPVRFDLLFREHPPEKALLLEDPRTQDPGFDSIITHSWIYSNLGNPLLSAFLEQMLRNYEEASLQRTIDITGPHAFTRFLNQNRGYLDGACVVDQCRFFRYDFHEVKVTPDRRTLLDLEVSGSRGGRPLVNLWTHQWTKPPPAYVRLFAGIRLLRPLARSAFERSKTEILA